MSHQWHDPDPGDVTGPIRPQRTPRKDIPVSAGLTGDDAELLDQLAAMQGTSHAEIVRRALRLLAIQCGLHQAQPGTDHWAIRP